jgi:hypothetical protein
MLQESMGKCMPHLSRFSSGQDFNPLGGFNPNILTADDINTVLGGSPELLELTSTALAVLSPASSNSWAATAKAHGLFGRMATDSIMADIINGGSAHPSSRSKRPRLTVKKRMTSRSPRKMVPTPTLMLTPRRRWR